MKHESATLTRRLMARRPRARRLGAAVVMVMALSPAVVITAPAAEAYTPSRLTVAAYEARVIYSLNMQRHRLGRRWLATAACPDVYAEHWASYLARTGAFYHQSMYPILRGCRASRVAENLARGNVTADKIVLAWMRSPGHRANILDARLSQIGVAAVYSRGAWTVAADFSRP